MSAERVATEALDALGARPWVIPGRMNAFMGFVIGRLLPRRAAVRIMGNTMRAMYRRT